MIRKFFNNNITELTDIFNSSQSNLLLLRELEDELKHRKTDKAKKLLSNVVNSINELSTKNEIIHNQPEIKQICCDFSDRETIKIIENGYEQIEILESTEQSKNVSHSIRTSLNEEQTVITKSFDISKFRGVGDWSDVPKKREFNLSDDLKLEFNESDSIIKKYRIALEALISEIRNSNSGAQRFLVYDGIAINLPETNNGYSFSFDGEVDVFDGLRVTAKIANEHFDGKVHSVNRKELILSFSKPLPMVALKMCTLLVDKAAFIEILKDRYKELENGNLKNTFNLSMANDMLNNESDLVPFDDSHVQFLQCKNLNEFQKKAVLTGLSNRVTYMWGPPGTGKTETITTLILHLYALRKRVLLISNTNQAVDQVLLKMCENIEALSKDDEESDLNSGKFIRIGKIKKDDLEAKFGEKLNLDSIVDMKTKELSIQKNELISTLNPVIEEIYSCVQILNKFKEMDAHIKDKTMLDSSQQKIHLDILVLTKTIENYHLKNSALTIELAKSEKSGAIRKIFLRDEDVLKADIISIQEKIEICNKEFNLLNNKIEDMKKRMIEIMNQLTVISNQLYGNSKEETEIKLAQNKVQKKMLENEIKLIENKLKEIKENILLEALLVGATVTKVFTTPNMFGNFDYIIADEASMIMLPALYFVAGLAKESIFISGDSRQLSPIVQTNQRAIYDLVGSDILTRIIDERGESKRIVKLEKQYRMCKEICELVSENYDKLITEKTVLNESLDDEELNNSLIVINTSELFPFVNKDVFKSRYNIINVVVGKSIVNTLDSLGEKNIGFCTPYAAQAKIYDRTLDQKKFVSGTIHRYQGDDKDTMILDLPDSLGDRSVGMFLEGSVFDLNGDKSLDPGTKLFNVAISRAKNRLIIIGNLSYLDAKLPKKAYLRKVIHSMINQGVVIDARGLFNLNNYQTELALDVNMKRFNRLLPGNAIYNEISFTEGVLSDIYNAEQSILIYSGFITLERVSSYELIFKNKLRQGIKIKCVTRPPQSNGSMASDETKLALQFLENIGCIVETRAAIHEKMVVIDNQTVWIGSLNPLSYNGKINEIMMRIEDSSLIRQLQMFLSIGKNKDENFDPMINENPRCPECASRTTYAVSKFGPFWSCEECNWKKSMR